MPGDWDPFHRSAVGAGPYSPAVVVAYAADAVAAAVAGAGEVVAAAAVKGLDYSLNTESQTSMHGKKLELHDEKVPKT